MLLWQYDRFCPIYIQFQKCFVYICFHLSRKIKLNMYYNLMRLPNVIKLKFVLFSIKMAMTMVTESNYIYTHAHTHTHQKRCKYLMMGQRKRAIMWKIYCFKNLKERNSSAIWSIPHLDLIVGTHWALHTKTKYRKPIQWKTFANK